MSLLFPLLLLQVHRPMATVKLESATASVGRPIKGTLTLTFPAGHHGYQNPPVDEYENPIRFTVVEHGFKLLKVEYPKGKTLSVPGLSRPSKVYDGTIRIPFSVVPTMASPAGMVTNVNFKVAYQLCTASNCYPPASMIVKAMLKVAK